MSEPLISQLPAPVRHVWAEVCIYLAFSWWVPGWAQRQALKGYYLSGWWRD